MRKKEKMCTTYHATLSSEETVRQLELLSPDRAKFHSSVIRHADKIPVAQDWSYSRH